MIAETFIRRPVTAIVISIVIVLVGIIAMSTLPIAQYPDITPPTVNITGSFIIWKNKPHFYRTCLRINGPVYQAYLPWVRINIIAESYGK